jgi:hypothetical protein
MLLSPFVSNRALPNNDLLATELEVIMEIVLSAVPNHGI